MKKILASIAAVVAISALSIAASAEGIGEATFADETDTTVSAVTLPASVPASEPDASGVDVTTEAPELTAGFASDDASATVNDDGGAATGGAASGADGLLIATNGAASSVASVAPEGSKVSSGVAEVILPVLAAAGAVAFIVSRKK